MINNHIKKTIEAGALEQKVIQTITEFIRKKMIELEAYTTLLKNQLKKNYKYSFINLKTDLTMEMDFKNKIIHKN